MTPKTTRIVTMLYGAALIASGLFRYLSREGGDKGLIFGLVTGVLALSAAFLMSKGRPFSGWALAALVVTFAGGWFTYEALILKGWKVAEVRQLLVVAASVIMAGALILGRPGRQNDGTHA